MIAMIDGKRKRATLLVYDFAICCLECRQVAGWLKHVD